MLVKQVRSLSAKNTPPRLMRDALLGSTIWNISIESIGWTTKGETEKED